MIVQQSNILYTQFQLHLVSFGGKNENRMKAKKKRWKTFTVQFGQRERRKIPKHRNGNTQIANLTQARAFAHRLKPNEKKKNRTLTQTICAQTECSINREIFLFCFRLFRFDHKQRKSKSGVVSRIQIAHFSSRRFRNSKSMRFNGISLLFITF